MNCSKCGKHLLKEDLGDGKVKLKCESCGTASIQDTQGRKLLTSDLANRPGKPLLG